MSSQTRLFVGNLPENINENELHSDFSSYGEIINLDLKSKSTDDNKKKFAFITLATTHHDLEKCIKHFSSHDYKGNRLYVTRARESFLERLQRERNQTEKPTEAPQVKNEGVAKKNLVINLSEKLNPRKRKFDNEISDRHIKKEQNLRKIDKQKTERPLRDKIQDPELESTQKQENSDKKRMESLKKKRQEFKEKQMIIKSGLKGIDKVPNKKVLFSDDEDSKPKMLFKHHTQDQESKGSNNKSNKSKLFDEDDSDNELNFEIKEHYEGKKGQKVLDLQSRYKSDKRFTLDERFVEESEDEEQVEGVENDNDEVEVGYGDEKVKQLNILQDVLGVSIKSKAIDPTTSAKPKTKMAMFRFDPSHPEHAKFLAPIEIKQDTKKSKKKKKEKEEVKAEEPEPPKIEVSKEQFYKVSEALKEAIAQPTTFSLRSLFGNKEDRQKEEKEQDTGYIPLEMTKEKKKQVKNPLNLGEKNPFVYDSSDSETEDKPENTISVPEPIIETKAVWKENLFFSANDNRLKEGLAFFNNPNEKDKLKGRRELKSLMKKRIYNKERKNQMFQKKIGGRKKTMKKSYRKKN